jgi:3-oxoacyl-[acyl-carrier protein] reductase
MKKLQGKVAIVTGASKGIGAAIAKAFAAEGASVVVNYATSPASAERVVAQIVESGGKATAVQADVSKASDVERLFVETKRVFHGLDILVNNAGVFRFEPIADVTEAEFQREFGVNVLGPILTTQRALAYFGPNGGSVINIGSVVSTEVAPNSVVYSATKSALESITRSLGRELGGRNIRVNTLRPGATDTEGARELGVVGGEFERQMVAKTPLGRLGKPEDIARAALFLASEDSAWVTGGALVASGGYG